MNAESELQTEHDVGERRRAADKCRALHPVAARPRPAHGRHDGGRDDQRAERVAEPPVEPQRAEPRPWLERRGAKSADADRRAERRTRGRGDHDVGQRAVDAAQTRIEARQPTQRRNGCDRFERVAGGDHDRGPRRRGGSRVGEKRTGPDRGPHPDAQEQQRGNRQAGRRPHGGHLLGDERDAEANLRRDHVGECDGRAERQQTKGGERRANTPAACACDAVNAQRVRGAVVRGPDQRVPPRALPIVTNGADVLAGVRRKDNAERSSAACILLRRLADSCIRLIRGENTWRVAQSSSGIRFIRC